MNSNLNKSLRRAKIKNVIRITIITVLTLIICLPLMYYISNKIVTKTSDKLMESLSIHNIIAEPNVQIDSRVLSNSSATGGEVTSNRSKNISGYVVPWDTQISNYSLFNFQIDFNELIPGTYQSDKNIYSYNKQTKQKVADFYHPDIDYSGYLKEIPNDLEKMDESKLNVSEMALSFDKPVKWSDISKEIPNGVEVKWLYLLSAVNEKKVDGPTGLEVFGVNIEKGYEQELFENFQENLSKYDSAQREGFIQNFLKENDGKKISDVSVLGVLVTGRNQDLKELKKMKNIRYSSVGVSVPTDEYINVE